PVVLPPLKLERPKLLVAPFDEREARARQQAWKRFLGKSDVVEENSLGMKLALIPPGEFMMGSGEDDIRRALREDPTLKREFLGEDEKGHRVRITRPLYLGACEVTVGEFRKFVDKEGYKTDAEKIGGFGFNQVTGKVEARRDYNWKNTGWPQDENHPV